MNRKRLKRRVRRVVGAVPGATRAARAARRNLRLEQDVRLVRASGAFDRQWYEVQLVRSFDSDVQAIRHYLNTGRKRGMSPHPLFEPSSASHSWRRSRADPLITELTGRGNRRRPHPAVTFGTPAATTSFATWAKKATPKTPVPVTGGDAISWAAYRTAALQIAAEQARQARLAIDPNPVGTRPVFRNDWPDVSAAAADPESPTVSIIMPTWNRAHLLKRAVASVQAQSFRDWELIVIDDGSDDDTDMVLEGMQARDPRIRPMATGHGGVCRARNAGIAAARGRYVAFLDSDNTWTPQFLTAAVAFAREQDAPWVHAGIEMRRDGTMRWRAFEGDREHLLAGNYIDLNVVLARRELIDSVRGFDETLRRAVDYDLVLRLSEYARPRLVPVLGAIYRQDDEDDTRISVAEPFAWNVLVKQRHLVREAGLTDPVAVTGRTSIIVPIGGRPGDAADLIDKLAATRGDVEVIAVLCDAGPRAGRIVAAVGINRPNVHVVSSPGVLNLAAALDLGVTRASGEIVVAWAPHCRVSDAWHPPLVAALDDATVGIAQPLNLAETGLIASAGAVFAAPDVFPSPLLGGMPPEDLALPAVTDLPAALSAVFAIRAADYRAAGGLNPLVGDSFAEVDLSLRMRDTAAPRSVLVRASSVVVTDPDVRGFSPDPVAAVRVLRQQHTTPAGSVRLWERTGFEVLGQRLEPLPESLRTTPGEGAALRVRPRVSENPTRLRWAIDIAAPAGRRGDQWGDWHFARSLARSLEKLGQQVHVDRREARGEAHRAFDDITVVLRGLDDVRPRVGSRSMMWIISHPDLVTAAEAARYDVVFAASEVWAQATSARWGIAVTPLLQCTDANLFRYAAAQPDTGPEFVFVGNSRGVRRTSVMGAVGAGVPLAVYGRGWDDLIPAESYAGEYIDNAKLPALYASAGVVLNDHWDDMRHEGFVSNRVFDVLATGGRIVSDDVPGLAELFGDAVPVFHSHLDLARLFAGDWRSRFPDHESRRATSTLVRTQHSFDARARTLLDTALRLRAADPYGE